MTGKQYTLLPPVLLKNYIFHNRSCNIKELFMITCVIIPSSKTRIAHIRIQNENIHFACDIMKSVEASIAFIKSFRVEEMFNVLESNRQPNTTMSRTFLCPRKRQIWFPF